MHHMKIIADDIDGNGIRLSATFSVSPGKIIRRSGKNIAFKKKK